MSNINNINESGQSFGTPKAKSDKTQKTDAFQIVLSNALGAKETSAMEPSFANALEEISSIGPVITSLSDMVSTKTGNLLDLLDAYSSKLEDPNMTLKSIAPTLEQIKTKAGTLEREAEKLPANEASLKKIATQTIATAQTEYFKFQRGDYLS
ncbi:MAG: hypothetical protein ABIJ31_00620 [Pseudomonadota bacterium]